MPRPSKNDLETGQDYLKTWEDYQRTSKFKGPLLLPISIRFKDGIIERRRIKTPKLNEMLPCLEEDFKEHCAYIKHNRPNYHSVKMFKGIIADYLNEFETQDVAQSAIPPGPLDFDIQRPVWIMFHFPDENWKFTKRRQFSMENDRDDALRNCEKICTMKHGSILLLANNYYSGPENLKYNLHLTITQPEGSTDIIIDPGMGNDTNRGPRD